MPTYRLKRRILRYGLTGISVNGVCLLAFHLAVSNGIHPVRANALCYGLGLVLSYLGNRYWTFDSRGRHAHDLLRFGGAHAVGFLSSLATMTVLLRVVPPLLAQVATIGIAAVVIFAILNLLKFGDGAQAARRSCSAESGVS